MRSVTKKIIHLYTSRKLSDNLIKQFLSQLNEYNYSEEKDKKDSDEYQFVDSIFIPERKIVLQANHKSKTVQIARIKIGSREYENAQILYQHGYQILHDKKKLSEKEIKKLLNKMEYDLHEPTGKPVGLIFKINLIGTTCKTDRISLALSE